MRGAPGPGGRPTITRRTVQADWIRVGRNASAELRLADPRVALVQGMIVDRDGLLYLEGEAGSADITGKRVRAVRLVPGKPIEIGPYRIEARATPPGYDGALIVEHLLPLATPGDLISRTSRLTLAAHGLSKRGAAWALGIAVLVLCLAIPAGRVLHLPWQQVAAQTPLGDRMWDPGPLMLAHQPIEQRCAACHETAFVHVRDGACLECHRTAGRHVAARPRNIADVDEARCATCHREHKGAKAVFRDDDAFCVACHANLRAHEPMTGAEDASDFATAHPAFRVTLHEAGTTVRVRQQPGTPMQHRTNLLFPHQVHLDAKGVRSPTRGRVRLDCANCHHPDAARRGFEAVSMARDCQECHRLQFEPAVTAREVPHGKPADAAMVIEEFYANLALKGTPDSFRKAFGVPGEGLLRRVGEASDAQREDALRMAGAKAKKVTRELFEVRVCKTCHLVSHDASTDAWKVAPVDAVLHWMPHAQFDHHAHASSKCADCHDVARSKDARDVAMPAIATCRQCHAGARPQARKIASNCLLCHAFHDPSHPWQPSAAPKVARAP